MLMQTRRISCRCLACLSADEPSVHVTRSFVWLPQSRFLITACCQIVSQYQHVDTLQRRCYWMLEGDDSIVLVHYLAGNAAARLRHPGAVPLTAANLAMQPRNMEVCGGTALEEQRCYVTLQLRSCAARAAVAVLPESRLCKRTAWCMTGVRCRQGSSQLHVHVHVCRRRRPQMRPLSPAIAARTRAIARQPAATRTSGRSRVQVLLHVRRLL